MVKTLAVTDRAGGRIHGHLNKRFNNPLGHKMVGKMEPVMIKIARLSVLES